MDAKVDLRRLSRLLLRVLNWGIALAVAGTWVGFAGRWWWFFDLFIHFRLQYSLACVAALGWLCLRKRRVLAAFTALSLGMNLWPVAKTTWVQASKAQLDATWGLKVVSFNALFNNPRTIDVVQSDHRPQVLAIRWITPHP